jgi:hypothetical protein
MHSEEYQKESLDLLQQLVDKLSKRPPLNAMYMISATTPYVLDYKERKHVFLYSANTLTLTLEDLGDITVPQNTWLNMGFETGLRVFASGQSANVPIFIKATDEGTP